MSDTPAVPQTRRRWLHFSLRTLFVLLTVVGLWLGWHVSAARRQQASVAAVRANGGWCYYDFQRVPGKSAPDYAAISPLPVWLVDQFGVDFFHDVVQVNLNYAYDAKGRHENSRGTGEDLKHLLGFPELRILLMHERQASDDGLAYVGRLTQLERLYIWDGYDITDAGVAHLLPLKKLEYLHLSTAKISDEAFKTFAEMPSLTGLSLQHNHFTNKALEYIREDTKLEQLVIDLGDLEVDDEGLAHLQNLVNLQHIGVQNSRVEGPGLRHLRKLQKLTELWVSNSGIKQPYLAEFQQQHPNCKISH